MTSYPPFQLDRINRVREFLVTGLVNGLATNPSEFAMPSIAYRDSCGTAACVLGWTPALFPELELDLAFDAWGEGDIRDKQGRYWGTDEACDFFGFTEQETDYLYFDWTHGRREGAESRKDAAQRLDEILAGKFREDAK